MTSIGSAGVTNAPWMPCGCSHCEDVLQRQIAARRARFAASARCVRCGGAGFHVHPVSGEQVDCAVTVTVTVGGRSGAVRVVGGDGAVGTLIGVSGGARDREGPASTVREWMLPRATSPRAYWATSPWQEG